MNLSNTTITMGYFLREDGQLSVGELKFSIIHNMNNETLNQICEQIQNLPHSEMNADIFCAFVAAWSTVFDRPEIICITEEIFEQLCKI